MTGTLSWPSDARLALGAINNEMHFLHGQMIGIACEWHEGVDARAQFVRNMRQAAKEIAAKIEQLDTIIFTGCQ